MTFTKIMKSTVVYTIEVSAYCIQVKVFDMYMYMCVYCSVIKLES